VKLVEAKRIRDLKHGHNGAGQSKSEAHKIENAVGFVAPKVAQCDFEEVSEHSFKF
jgi:hypothetical protein